jgi:hypothetical protein
LSPVTVGALTLTSDTASDAVDLDRSRVVVVDAEADNSNLSSTSSTRLSLTDSVGEFSDSEIEDENTPPRDPELLLEPVKTSSDSLPLRTLALYP